MSDNRNVRDYSLFGLTVRSSVPLPGLFAAGECVEPDVHIDRGRISEADDAPEGLSQVDGGLVLVVGDVARFKIEDGKRIVVDALPGVPERNVRLFLLGSAFGALLHQRGLLPLHANAVEIGGKAVAFMGHSGAGKSTLAAWFHDKGYRILADDVCVVRFDDEGRALACPGVPHLRLWSDAIRFTGRSADDFTRSYVGADEELEKFDVPIAADDPIRGESALAAVYLLQQGDRFAIEPLIGVAAAQAIFENTYRGRFLSAASARNSHWNSASKLVQTIPVFSAMREWSLDELGSQCTGLLAHARKVIG